MKKIFLSLLLIVGYLLALSLSNGLTAQAAGVVSCQPIYGGGQTCVQAGNIVIDKKIAHPKTNILVDNLGINDDKFAPDSVVTFQLAITNTGGSRQNSVTVRDIYPQFVDFSAGAGNYDANTKTLNFDLNDLNPNETRTFNLVGKVVSVGGLPTDRAIVCVVNQATATADGQTSQDNAQLCIERALQPQPGVVAPFVPSETKGGLKVFPPQKVITTTPPTGPEALPLIALLPTGALGYFLRKKSQPKADRPLAEIVS